ncbi:MAG: pyridoxal phosphate-dependent aminotransferase [Bdellovibrionales bacterium]|nr:pyridoxal phosphate-dependent aminotransferase [Bdellovibrionales bacterium]
MSGGLYRKAARLTGVESSPTLRLNALAQEMIRQGKDVMNLTAGETDFETPAAVCDAAVEALRKGKTRYTNPHGTPELRSAVAGWFLREFGLRYEREQVTVTCGVKQGLFHLLLATVGPGDEVIVPAPYWVSYPEMVRLAAGVPVIVPPAEDFSLDVDAVLAAVGPRTRMVILNSPSNPTGAVVPEKELERLARGLEGSDVLVASDEIYNYLVYDGASARPFAAVSPDAAARTVTFNGLSKSHAMTGWRVGFAAGPRAVIDAMGILQAQSATNITTFVQDAAVEALRQTRADFEPRRQDLEERRNFCLGLFAAEPRIRMVRPAGAFYLFPDVSQFFGARVGGSEAMAEFLLERAGVAVVPGKPFGEDRCIRLSFSKDKSTLEKGILRLIAAMKTL